MIIVTGGAGFIGSILVAELERRGFGPLIIIDELGTGSKWKNVSKRQIFDIVSPSETMQMLQKYSENISTIFHLGAISDTTCADADLIFARNCAYTLALWEWCSARSVTFLYASSAATYGRAPYHKWEEDVNTRLARLRPLNLYGWSKHFVDRRITYDASVRNFSPPHWAGFKFFNVYGPNEYHKGNMRSVASVLYDQIISGEPARLFKSDHKDYADGGQMRDFVYVDDVVDAMIWFMQFAPSNGIFDLGTGQARSFLDVANAVFSAVEREPNIIFIDMPEQLKGRYQYFTQANMAALQNLGWTHEPTALEIGVKRYLTKYLETEDPYF